MDEVKKHHLCH